ncbi:MAG: alpha-xylosidase [Rikenellaceae bacterium]
MSQTNYQLFDFLDFDQAMSGNESIWIGCAPLSAWVDQGDVVLDVPFQKQIVSNDIEADFSVAPVNYQLRLRAYGDKILRVAVGFNQPAMQESVMLEMDATLQTLALKVEENEDAITIIDSRNVVRARVDRKAIETDFWSDLHKPPQRGLELSFFPDGKKEIKLNAYDIFFPARYDAYGLAAVERDGELDSTTLSLEVKPDEKFVGTGERFTKMDLSGRTFQLKNQDGQGVNNRRTYKNIPFILSSRMYGVFLHTSSYGKISVADHSARSLQFLIEEPAIDIFLIGGENPEQILKGYRRLSGFPTMLPKWSFGTWMSRMTYFSEDEVKTICNRLRKEDYPCDVIHLDTGWFETDWLCEWKFNKERFPDPKRFVQELLQDGYKVSLWQLPYIAEGAEQEAEATQNNYICKVNNVGQRSSSNFSALDYVGTIDFTYPKATEWYKGLLRELLDMGVKCIKTDFGEEIHLDAVYHDMDPRKLNNLYGLLYQKAAYEVTKEVTGDGIIWARAGWAGCQRYPLHWGGDSACSWDGLAGSLKGGLHFGLSGFAFWSHDVPGFHGVPDFMNSVIPDDLYVRWTQFGVFTSHIRYHGTSKREPYEYPNISDIVRKWWKLRYALIPYILEQSEKATQTGYPLLRAMIFHHPKDKVCWHIDDQYFFGDDFLVAPIINSENRRDIYLPKGDWVNLFSGKEYRGEAWLNDFECPLDEMPVWVRKGAVVSVYPHSVSNTDEMDMTKVERLKFDESYSGLGGSILNSIVKI